MNQKLQKSLISGGVFLVLAILPIIPVLRAAVVPNPIYRQVWISLVGLIAASFRLGVTYQFAWFTAVGLAMLLGGGWWLSHWLIRKFVERN